MATSKITFNHESGQKGSFKPRSYDMRISVQNKGGKYPKVVFSFTRSGRSKISYEQYGYMEFSTVTSDSDRIYFRFSKKATDNSYKLQRQLNKCMLLVTVRGSEFSLIKNNWAGHTYELNHDEQMNLFYVEKPNEKEAFANGFNHWDDDDGRFEF